MTFFIYDHTFEGLLTAVFESYSRKIIPDKIIPENGQLPLFVDHAVYIVTQEQMAQRVWKGLQKKLSPSACSMLAVTFLADYSDVSSLLFHYICKAVNATKSIETNFTDNDVLEISKLYKKVYQEANRIKQFVRFQKSSDDIFFAPMAPIHNVLPLTIEHFKDRFADQKWIIYDTKRRYGYFYDLVRVEEITFDGLQTDPVSGKLNEESLSENEKLFQQMWKTYFKSMTIKERINPKLHRQNLPKRFWRYLTEKQ